jgi:hypothetical protein
MPRPKRQPVVATPDELRSIDTTGGTEKSAVVDAVLDAAIKSVQGDLDGKSFTDDVGSEPVVDEGGFAPTKKAAKVKNAPVRVIVTPPVTQMYHPFLRVTFTTEPTTLDTLDGWTADQVENRKLTLL